MRAMLQALRTVERTGCADPTSAHPCLSVDFPSTPGRCSAKRRWLPGLWESLLPCGPVPYTAPQGRNVWCGEPRNERTPMVVASRSGSRGRTTAIHSGCGTTSLAARCWVARCIAALTVCLLDTQTGRHRHVCHISKLALSTIARQHCGCRRESAQDRFRNAGRLCGRTSYQRRRSQYQP